MGGLLEVSGLLNSVRDVDFDSRIGWLVGYQYLVDCYVVWLVDCLEIDWVVGCSNVLFARISLVRRQLVGCFEQFFLEEIWWLGRSSPGPKGVACKLEGSCLEGS